MLQSLMGRIESTTMMGKILRFDDPYVLIGKFFGYTVRSNIAGYEKE